MLFAVRQPFSLWTARRVLSVARCTFSTDDSSRPFPSPHPTRPIQNALPSKRGTNEFQLPSSLVEKTQHHEQTRDSSSCDSSSNLKCTAETDVLDQSSSVEHLFDTYKLLQVLERQGFTRTQAEIVMKGIKYRLRDSSAYIRQHLLQRSDLDNEMYLFKAGLSELRTEVQTMRRNNIQTLQAEGSVVTREVEVLEQKLREDVATMKSDVTLEVNNRKNEAREELKAIDMKIQELNNRITVSLGDVRTDLEAVRWETIWKGMTGVAVVGLSLAGLGYVLTNYACRKAEEERIEQQRQLKLLQDEARHARTAEMEVIYS